MKLSIMLFFRLFLLLSFCFSCIEAVARENIKGFDDIGILSDESHGNIAGNNIAVRRIIAAESMSRANHRRLANYVGQWREALGSDHAVELIYVKHERDEWKKQLFQIHSGICLTELLHECMSANVASSSQINQLSAIDSALLEMWIHKKMHTNLVMILDSINADEPRWLSGVRCDVSVFDAMYSAPVDTLIAAYDKYYDFIYRPIIEMGDVAEFGAKSCFDLVDYAWNGRSRLARLFEVFMQDVTECSITAYAPNCWFDSLGLSNVNFSDIERILPFDNDLVVVGMKGIDLIAYMNKSMATRFRRMRNENSDLLHSKVPSYLHVQIRGINKGLDYDLIKGRFRLRRGDICSDSTYHIAMSSYHASKLIDNTGVDMDYRVVGDYRFLFAQWLSMQTAQSISTIIEQCDKNQDNEIVLIPHRWAEIARGRESKMLYDFMLNKDYQP